MIRSALFGFLALASTARGLDPQSQAELLPGVNDTWNLRWWGVTGRSYFLQASDDLQTWHFAPLIEGGNDEAIEYETGALGERYFIRVVYTDQTAPDLDAADFDGDNLSNLAEITTHHTHPLRSDSDNDSLPDDWEIGQGLDPNDDGSTNPINGANGDPDGDGVGNLNEHLGKTDPKNAAQFPPQLLSVANKADMFSSSLSGGSFTGYYRTYLWSEGWSGQTPISGETTPERVSLLLDGVAFPETAGEALQQHADKVATETLGLAGSVSGSASFSNRENSVSLSSHGVNAAQRCWLKVPAKPYQQDVKVAKVTWKRDPLTSLDSVSQVEGVTFTIPANSQYSNKEDLKTTGVAIVNDDAFTSCNFIPVDGVVRYPSDIVMSETDENVGDGALISLLRLNSEGKNVAPLTAIEVAAPQVDLSGCKLRFKFSSERFVAYKDALEANEVKSEVTEFDARIKNVIYLSGEDLSPSRGAEEIAVQLGFNGQWITFDTIKATVIQAEFPIDLRVFIPYDWVNIPSPFHTNRVAKGDHRGFDPTLGGSYRLAQGEVVNPYPQFVKKSVNRLVGPSSKSAGETAHYNNSDVTNFDDDAVHSGLVGDPPGSVPSPIDPSAAPVDTGFADISKLTAAISEASTNDYGTVVNFKGSSAEPLIAGAASIDWDIDVSIIINDPLNPLVTVVAKHDNFPAYEVYINANHPILPVTEALQTLPPLPASVWELSTNLDFNFGPVTQPIKK